MKKDTIIERFRITEEYYGKKHTINLPCKNGSGYCFWQWAISGAGKIEHCFCSAFKGLEIKPKAVRAIISE